MSDEFPLSPPEPIIAPQPATATSWAARRWTGSAFESATAREHRGAMSQGRKPPDERSPTDGAAFSMHEGLRSTMTALSVANAELQRSFGLLQVTRAGLRRAADALVSFRKNLLAPVGPIALPERWAEALALVRGCFSSAVYGGKSLFDDVGGGFPAASVMARLEAAMAGPAEQQAREVNAVVQGVEQWIKAVERDMGDITHQLERNSQVIDRLSHGLGSLVDVDLDAEAAQLKALQVQQQLSKSGVGLGNGVPSTLLALFR